jgi:hypothetical protein
MTSRGTASATAGPSAAQFAKCANCFAQDDIFEVVVKL